MTKVSFITTIRNEKHSIELFIRSVFSQSLSPDEVIIVDGGSTDGTVEIINRLIAEGLPIRLIIEPGSNIARGRNIAISNAVNDIIAISDAGCTLDEHWLATITKPFKDPEVDVVAGFYSYDAKTTFEKITAALSFPTLQEIDPDSFLPSSRSFALRKQAWKEVNGYPEWLYTAEDTLFCLNLKAAGRKFFFEPKAIVYWRPRPNLRSLYKQMYLYAFGDGEAGLFPNQYLKIYVRYVAALMILLLTPLHVAFLYLLLIGLALFVLNDVRKGKRRINSLSLSVFIPFFHVVADLARMVGYCKGRMKRRGASVENRSRNI
jgi:glycosyltransferase involved in cell wall biosynthesis